MDTILHLIGLCHDTQSHFDLMDLCVGGFAGISATFAFARCKVRSLIGK